jgi:hypothetical protein
VKAVYLDLFGFSFVLFERSAFFSILSIEALSFSFEFSYDTINTTHLKCFYAAITPEAAGRGPQGTKIFKVQ